MEFTFDSLFAGIGGFDLGLERAGMVCRRQVEIDIRCRQVLTYHWPDVERMSDVRKASGLNAVDLVCGGFPCQDVSVAGRRVGLDGKRSGLWFEFLRIIKSARPQWVVIENVPGLLSSNEKQDFAVVLQGLAESGYWWAYRILDAQYWGVPQRRRRVFIVASFGDWRGPVKVLFERKSSPWDTAPCREPGQKVAGTIAAGAHSGGLNGRDVESGNVVYGLSQASHPLGSLELAEPITNRNGDPGICVIAKPLTAHHGRNCAEDTFIPVAYSESGPGWWRDGVGCLRAEGENRPSRPLNVLAFDTTQITSPENRSNPQPGDPCHTLNANAHPPSMAGQFGVRRFTNLECERLQGFPDNWTNVKGMSDSARYKMLGNAVAVPVVEWLGRRIMQVEDSTDKEHTGK